MHYIAFTLMGIAMFVALATVGAGLVVMSRGGEVNRRWGNRLMRYRVYAQTIAIGMFLFGAWLSKQ